MADQIKKRRSISKGAFTRCVKSVDMALTAKAPEATITKRFQAVTEAKKEVDKIHMDYENALEGVDSDSDNWIAEVCSTFDDLELKVDLYIDSLQATRECLKKAQDEKLLLRKVEDLRIEREEAGTNFNLVCECIENILKRSEDTDKLVEPLRASMSNLESCKTTCEDAHQRYLREESDTNKKREESNWMKHVHQKYSETYTRSVIFIAENSKSTSEGRATGRSVRFERIKFESFDGDLRRYPQFKSEFINHIRPTCEPKEEAFVLRSYLERSVREEIECLGDNIEDIWKRLDALYGNRRKLIDSILADIKQLRQSDDQSPMKTLKIIEVVEKAHRDLKYLGLESEINNATIVSAIEEKLPMDLQNEWFKKVTELDESHSEDTIFPRLLELLQSYKRRLEYKHSDLRSKVKVQKGFSNFATSDKGDRMNDTNAFKRSWCWLHPSVNDHPIWKCETFRKMDVEDRLSSAKENRACFRCLEQGHSAKTCRRNFTCKEDNCGRLHHYLLHQAQTGGSSFRIDSARDVMLQLQQIDVLSQNLTCEKINVLWDCGSTLSFITFEKARELELTPKRKLLVQIEKVGGELEEIDSYEYELKLLSKAKRCINLKVLGIEKISSGITSVDFDELEKVFPIIDRNDIKRPTTGEVECLIGFEYAALHPVSIANVKNLLLMENLFGFVVAGVSENTVQQTEQFVVRGTVKRLGARVQDFYDIESLGVHCQPKCGSCKCGECQPGAKNMTLREEREYRLIESNLKYDETKNRWTAGYPWIKDPSGLPNNKDAVMGALRSCEKKLSRNSELAELYASQIDDMINRKVCRKVSKSELDDYTGPKYYIPHHEVIKEESQSTPCRIVFNSSAVCNGHALNDYFAKGPDMLNNLAGVLLRFREERYAFVGDISKMYHSIDISLKDQMTHLFLWRSMKSRQDPDVYAMTVVNFGDKPSAAIALAALHKTAEMYKHFNEEAAQCIKCSSYMDDIIDSKDSVDKAELTIDGIDEILQAGGFKIKEWIKSYDNKNGNVTEMPEVKNDMQKVLGMHWDKNKDEFCFIGKLSFGKKLCLAKNSDNDADLIGSAVPNKLTKRQILSQINGIYDPLGLVSPFTVRAKILMRKLWAEQKDLGWDDPIKEEHYSEWKEFFSEFSSLHLMKVQRCIKPSNTDGQPSLVILSDASKDAYGAVAYIRWQLTDGTYQSRLLTCKNRVSPVRIIDIVRLELIAAVLGTRLRMFIMKHSRFEFESVMHLVDSEIVNAMIRKESYGFNTFVANRLGEIHEFTDVSEWAWINGKQNIADWTTRGKNIQEISRGSEWQSGPEFLKLPVSEWPIVKSDSSSCEMKNYACYHMEASHKTTQEKAMMMTDIDISRFSSMKKLINSTAFVLKFCKLMSDIINQTESQFNDLVFKEKAENVWIKDAQKSLMKEFQSGKLLKLCPKIKNGILVVGGRVQRWNAATWNRSEFVLIPSSHPLAELIVRDEHVKSGHAGQASTLARVRGKFWILKGRRLVGRIIHNCVVCRRRLKNISEQVMSDLPIERLQPTPAFFYTSIDYFGPFVIRGEVQKRVRGKAYGVILTCFTSRAVFIDVAKDYSTDAFLQLLRRFASVRGWPRKFYSDKGSQIMGASRELTESFNGLDKNMLKRYLIEYDTEWEFTCGGAPWMNGLSEALVKSAKKCLTAAIGDQVMEFSTLQTAFFEVAQIMNSRPIGLLPENPDDGAYLCPNDLILGRASNTCPQGPFIENGPISRTYVFIQRLVDSFWKKWTRDYFPTLVPRQKWHISKRNVQIGDVVILRDENALRGEWRLAKVTAVKESTDGRVRKVAVSYKNNDETDKSYTGKKYTTVDRHVHSLAVIVPVEDQ